jgi:hypothetical protein
MVIQIFSQICEHICKSLCITGINDTGGSNTGGKFATGIKTPVENNRNNIDCLHLEEEL